MIPGRVYSVGDLAAIAWARKWAIVGPLVLVAVATAILATFLPDRYRAETLILIVPQRIPEAYVRATVTARIEDRLAAISQQILSRTRLERIINDFGLYRNLTHVTKDDVIEGMRSDISVQIVEGDAFRVGYEADDATIAMNVTDRLAALFIEESLKDREVLAKGTSAFLQSQLENARNRLVEHEKRIEQFRRDHSGELPSQLDSNLQVIQNTQVQLQLLADTLNRDRDRRLLVDRSVTDLSAEIDAAAGPVVAAEGTPSGDSAPLLVQLESARSTLAAMETRFKPEHPNAVRQKRVVENLERKIAESGTNTESSSTAARVRMLTPADMNRQNRLREMRSERESLDRQIVYEMSEEGRLRGVIADYQARVEAVPARESEMTALTRDYDTLRGLYTSLLAKEEDSRIAANLEQRQIGEQFKILDPASRPDRPFQPNRPLINLAGIFAGLVIGVGVAALLEYRDVSLNTQDDVQAAVAAPILAMIPTLMTTTERVIARRRQIKISVAVVVALVVVAVAMMRVFRM